MNSPQSVTSPGPLVAIDEAGPGWSPARRLQVLRGARVAPRHLALAAILALSAVLNVNRLSQNGYANIFYSAGVRSMLRSLHNFVFVSFDPGGLVTVDKPPLALWVQAASAKLFGFSPLSLLLPEAIAGVLSVALLYYLMAVASGSTRRSPARWRWRCLPSFVAVSRDNGVDPRADPADAARLRSRRCGPCETGRWRTLLWCGVLVGLAFNTKTLAAYLVVPGIALAYLGVRAGVDTAPHLMQLLVARPGDAGGLVLVDRLRRTHARLGAALRGQLDEQLRAGADVRIQRPRPRGRPGGRPGQDSGSARARYVPRRSPRRDLGDGRCARSATRAAPAVTAAPARLRPPAVVPMLPDGRDRNPIPFGGPTGPLRLFGVGLGDQAGWMLPFALFGLFGAALADRASAPHAAERRLAAERRRAAPPPRPARGRPAWCSEAGFWSRRRC